MSDEEFVRFIVMDAREEYKRVLEEKWPERVASLGIPYSKYEWERIKENFDLLKSEANKKNLKVQIMEKYVHERYLTYSYIYYEGQDN